MAATVRGIGTGVVRGPSRTAEWILWAAVRMRESEGGTSLVLDTPL